MAEDREKYREKVIDKIRKLRAKGENAAVSEEEANAFLDAAAKLMRKHRVDDGDLARAGIDVDRVYARGVHVSTHKMHPACATIDAIGKLTGTHIGVGTTTTRRGRRWSEENFLSISGRPQDREVAAYMFDQVRNLIDGAWRAERDRRLPPLRRAASQAGVTVAFILRDGTTKKMLREYGYAVDARARRSFGFGMAHRVAKRIEAMAVRHGDAANALVVWREKITPNAREQKRPDYDISSYWSGDNAGKSASLGQGVAAGQPAVLSLEHLATEGNGR